MAEYIERDAAKDELLSWAVCIKHPEHLMKEDAMHILDSIPAADVVPKGAYDQVAWERDIAIQQLREDYGVGLGEKKAADVVEVVHGRWIYTRIDANCSHCGFEWFASCQECGVCPDNTNYCPNCGARMDGADVQNT